MHKRRFYHVCRWEWLAIWPPMYVLCTCVSAWENKLKKHDWVSSKSTKHASSLHSNLSRISHTQHTRTLTITPTHTQGCEFSYQMLIASNYILNYAPEKEAHAIHPWVLASSNVWDAQSQQFQRVRIKAYLVHTCYAMHANMQVLAISNVWDAHFQDCTLYIYIYIYIYIYTYIHIMVRIRMFAHVLVPDTFRLRLRHIVARTATHTRTHTHTQHTRQQQPKRQITHTHTHTDPRPRRTAGRFAAKCGLQHGSRGFSRGVQEPRRAVGQRSHVLFHWYSVQHRTVRGADLQPVDSRRRMDQSRTSSLPLHRLSRRRLNRALVYGATARDIALWIWPAGGMPAHVPIHTKSQLYDAYSVPLPVLCCIEKRGDACAKFRARCLRLARRDVQFACACVYVYVCMYIYI